MPTGIRGLVATLGLFVLSGCTGIHSPSFQIPDVMLWAWQRPEDLRYIDAHRVGVAFLAATATLSADGSVDFHPRQSALLLNDDVVRIAVVRIESPVGHRDPLPEAFGFLVDQLGRIAAKTDVRGLQIDFDARRSERDFYRKLLAGLRKANQKPIGVTALASWCSGDRWLDDEPVAEAVPMMFRMGRGENRDMIVISDVCAASIGLSTDEAWPAARSRSIRRIYIFDPHAWTEADYRAALERVEVWH